MGGVSVGLEGSFAHLRLVASRDTKVINVIKALSRVSWGTDTSVLLMIYRHYTVQGKSPAHPPKMLSGTNMR